MENKPLLELWQKFVPHCGYNVDINVIGDRPVNDVYSWPSWKDWFFGQGDKTMSCFNSEMKPILPYSIIDDEKMPWFDEWICVMQAFDSEFESNQSAIDPGWKDIHNIQWLRETIDELRKQVSELQQTEHDLHEQLEKNISEHERENSEHNKLMEEVVKNHEEEMLGLQKHIHTLTVELQVERENAEEIVRENMKARNAFDFICKAYSEGLK
jgi:hypothetical protein